MTRKVIIDCDPGIDDAVALCLALFDPRLEVLAITATAGTVDAPQATLNVQAILSQLDPAKYPRIGVASPPTDAPVWGDGELNGAAGLGEFRYEPSDRQRHHPSDKVISELLRRYPNEITLICLGPLTNIARTFQRDPSVIKLVDKLIISGGSVTQVGNVTPAAEFNMFFDPPSAQAVFQSATTKSLVPLDVTEPVTFGVDLLEKLPSRQTAAGKLLHPMLQYAFRTSHQQLGREVIPLYDPVTLIAALEPSLFGWSQMAGAVESRGELTRGATVFDRRARPQWPMNMEVARRVDSSEVQARIVHGLRCAGQHS
jgi:purine nucleosidase